MSTVNPRPSAPSRRSSTASAFSSPSFTTSTTRNPISHKVQRLWSANLEDAGTRAALDTLGQLERGEQVPGRAGGAGAASAGRTISSALKRGGLRKEIDGKMAEGSREFLEAFSEVNDELRMLQSHLNAMHVCCDEVQTELDKASRGTRYLLEHAEGLRQQRATTSVQQSLAHVFLTRFTLTDAELRALTPREVSVGAELMNVELCGVLKTTLLV